MARPGFLLARAVVLALALLGSAPFLPAAGAAPVHVALVPIHAGEYADALLAGAQKAAKDLAGTGGEAPTVEVFLPATADVAGQTQAILKGASAGCAGMILSPVGGARSPNFLGRIEEAFRSGCTGIVVDAPFSSPYIAGLVGTGFYQSGQEAGAFLAKRIGGDGGVLIVGDPKASLGVSQFEKGMIEGLRLYPNALAITSGDLAQGIPGVAASEVGPILKRLGGKVAALCVADPEAWPEVARALKEAAAAASNGGNGAKPVVMVYGNRKETLAALGAGEIDSVIADCPYLIGYHAMKGAVAGARGKPVAAQRNVATKIITTDKLADPKIAEFLNPEVSGVGLQEERAARPILLDP
ncbi:ABC-type sugar transport system, substrate-binding protein, contains N-terminal xre family HTH domain [Verrucomicrobium sp. GAS474]|uniref:sugar ABC transporter substrate-binding protein n=1 Tax=Verrucomicrobium sp. GAS474 TaxID=1882831 RepID=UPI00087DE624|nr:substrate-binding domain-containing protein [Verrucomicrobium sp. GAS474]SDU06475.1 ABC-type sugar transport system, substrate-binding protein, contains N-terminal xre family HTH domain [Verrucomicrobium sp. GAS474]